MRKEEYLAEPQLMPNEKITMGTTVEQRDDAMQKEELGLQSADDLTESENEFRWNINVIGNLFALYMVIFVNSWATGVPATAIAFIAARFPDGASNAAWIATSSSVTSAVMAAFIGNLSDIFDRRSFLLGGCAFSCAGLLVGGLAVNMNMVIGGQALNGLGIGCGFLAVPLLQEIVPKNQRALATALSVVFSSVSFIGAPIFEGLLIEKGVGGPMDGWRVGFYIGAGLLVLTFVSLFTFYRPMPRPNPEGLTALQRLRTVDWPGIFLASSGITLFLVGFNSGDNPHKWSSGYVLGPLISGTLLLVVFGVWEWKGTSTGILPHAVFQDRNFNAALFIRISGGFALYGCQAFVPQMVVYTFGKGGLLTTVWQLPLNVSTVLGAMLSALILRWYKELRYIILALLATLSLGAGLMLLSNPGVSFAVWFFPTALMGLAIGSDGAVITILSGLATPNDAIATAICIGVAAGFIGGAMATTMYSQVVNAKTRELLPPAVSTAALDAGYPQTGISLLLTAFGSGGVAAVSTLPGASPEVFQAVTQASRAAYSEAFDYIWYILLAFSALTMAACWFFTSTTKYFTNEVVAPVVERPPQKTQPAEAQVDW